MATPARSRLGFLLINMAAFVVVVAGMKAASYILVQVLLAIFLAAITSPAFFFLQRRGIRPVLALLLLIGLLLLLGLFGFSVVSNSAQSFADNLPKYQEKIMGHMDELEIWLNMKGVAMPAGKAKELLATAKLFDYAKTAFGAVSGLFGQGLIILLITAFFLLEAAMLPKKVAAAVGRTGPSYDHVQEALINVRRYMGMKTLVSLFTGFLVWIMALIFRLDYPLLLGVMAFLLNYIPSIGSFMAAIPGVILALVQFGPGRAAWVAVVYTIINVGIGNILEPRIMGRGLGLSPAIILISLVFWGWVLGPIGMLLSVPLTLSIKIGLQTFDETRGLALLLGASAPKETPAEETHPQAGG
ncbi:MAG: AI-2E family transporter [Lentisphaeria bacterium]|nr:AI-2E family transporter [Lentisphaeria bacterium]